jgi:hypothetical protein
VILAHVDQVGDGVHRKLGILSLAYCRVVHWKMSWFPNRVQSRKIAASVFFVSRLTSLVLILF